MRFRNENEGYEQELKHFTNTIRKTVDYGISCLDLFNKNHRGDYADLVIVFLYRHILEMADGVEQLVAGGCAEPAKPLIRSLFEGFLSLEYILEADSERRAIAYQIGHAYNKIGLYKKVGNDSSEGEEFRRLLAGDKLISTMSSISLDTQARVDNLENLFKEPKFDGVNAEWCKNKKRQYWFSVYGGPNNVRELAEYLGYAGCYEILYRQFSNVVHATGVLENLRSHSGQPIILPLRYPKDIKLVVSLTMGFLIGTIKNTIQFYGLNEVADFGSWYAANIRGDYLQIASTTED